MTATNSKRRSVDASSHFTIDETSFRYDGWRIVVVCFLVATFGWGLGFYGQSVYLAELHRAHGWSASLVSGATTFFYLFGALIVVFVGRGGAGSSVRATACWQACSRLPRPRSHDRSGRARPGSSMLADALLSFGWAGTSLAIITNTLGLWFDQKRGMAISLALNGASFGGIVGVPLLVIAIGRFGFSGAMIAAAIAMMVLVDSRRPDLRRTTAASSERGGRRDGCGCAVAVANPRARVARCRLPVGVDRVRAGAVRAGRLHRAPDRVPRSRDRARTCRDRGRAADGDGDGRARAVLDRDRPAQPAAGLGALVSAARPLALAIVINSRNETVLIAACALFGFSVGNLITLPSLIVQREFDPALVRRADQPDHRDQPGHLRLRPGRHRPAARCSREATRCRSTAASRWK